MSRNGQKLHPHLQPPPPSSISRLRRAGLDASVSNLDELLTVSAHFFGLFFLLLSGVGSLWLDNNLNVSAHSAGKPVLIVNGMHRGTAATLVALDEKSFSVTVKLEEASTLLVVQNTTLRKYVSGRHFRWSAFVAMVMPFVEVVIKLHLECKLRFSCATFRLPNKHWTNFLVHIEANCVLFVFRCESCLWTCHFVTGWLGFRRSLALHSALPFFCAIHSHSVPPPF